ncbi:hypothetical protein R9C00_24415 [Flammeovirgaceae bacterium SG7u.111]|nr:hypothetical protein [Flammeovirgaceae bacterium SG7u.132]WPO34847.1 hypothetical protein R9C00_24415 [Flammeovirgaceae bacterium SG7u.111]
MKNLKMTDLKAPIVLNTLAGLIVLIGIIWFIRYQIEARDSTQLFYRQKTSSYIISSTSYFGRSEEFQLDNGATVYFLYPVGNKIAIGDSISKEENTYFF